MKRICLVVLIAMAMGLIGCVAKAPVFKDWAAVGGSRADATVRFSYSYNPREEIPETNDLQLQNLAQERCASWGYPDVEAFGGVETQCRSQFYNGWTGRMECVDMLVSKTFQCVGRGDAAVFTHELKR